VVDLVCEFWVWLIAGIARALGRADSDARENEVELRQWERIEGRR
jgi:hypothetical protein